MARKLLRSGQNHKGKKNFNMADVWFSKPEVTKTTPLSGEIFYPKVRLAIFDPLAKFK